MVDDSSRAQRRHKRYSVNFSVEISATHWQEVVQLTTDNVSRGGLFIRSSRPLEVGTRLHIRLKLPDAGELDVEGTVVHSVTPERAEADEMVAGFGVRFDERHAIDLSLLEAMAASNAEGRNTYTFDDDYISLPATLLDTASGSSETTEAYHLVEKRADQALDESSDEIPIDESAIDEAPTADGDADEQPLKAGDTSPGLRRKAQVRRPAAARAVFGIDFGTSYSSIALVTENGIAVLADEDGNTMLPSAVCYPESGPPLVGWPAREKIASHPSTTFLAPKRLLGRRHDDPALQPLLHESPLQLLPGPDGQIVANVYGQPMAMPQVSAEIFRRLARIGEHATGQKVDEVVLSAPVGYQQERAAITRAAQLAGLRVVAMMDEPVAAALAHRLGHEDTTVAVYDFGGGTFDFTLVRIQGGRFRVAGEAGDAWLGGDDFDRALADHAADQFEARYKVDLRRRQVEWQRLLMLCEAAKRRLSTEHEAKIFAKGVVLSIRGPIDLESRIDRELLTRLCGALVDRSIDCISGCLDLAGEDPEAIEHLVLVGGVSRMPLVRERVQEYFKREVRLAINPEHAVVVGNAVYAHHLASKPSTA